MRCWLPMKILPLLILVLFVAAACAPAPVLRDDALLSDDSLISGEPCAAPCFRGITPGETSWGDALTIIKDDQEFSADDPVPEEDSPAIQVAWRQGNDDAPVCCQMVTQDGETVSLLFLRTAPEQSLGDLIETHGPPTYLAGQDFTSDQAIMSLVYPDVPMVIYVFIEGAETGELSRASEVIGALYFVEEDMAQLLQTTDLHEWDGFQSYSVYAEGEFEITPSVTLTPTPE